MLALGLDWTCLCHYFGPRSAEGERSDTEASLVSFDWTRPVDEKPLWNLSVRDRTLGDGESGRSTRCRVCLCTLGAIGAQQ